MPRKLAIRNPEKIACQIRSLVFETARTRFQVRLHTVLLIACGMPVPELAKIYGIAPTTIHRWIHRLNRQGITGLKERSGRGRKSCLSSRDRRRLCLDLNTSPPPSGLWGHPMVRQAFGPASERRIWYPAKN